MTIASLETIIDMQLWCRTWPPTGSSRIRAKPKITSQETQRSLEQFLEFEWKPKVIYTDISLEFGEACEDLSWDHCSSTPHRSETNGIAERAVRRVKGRHLCCIVAFRSEWKLVGRFYGVLHLSAKRHRCIIWWEDALWKTFSATI